MYNKGRKGSTFNQNTVRYHYKCGSPCITGVKDTRCDESMRIKGMYTNYINDLLPKGELFASVKMLTCVTDCSSSRKPIAKVK